MAVIAIIIVFLFVAFLGALAAGALLWLAWNHVLVNVIDGVNDISFWGAVLVMMVLNIIFGGAHRASRD